MHKCSIPICTKSEGELFQTTAHKDNSVDEGVFGRSTRVLMEYHRLPTLSPTDHTATYSASYWTLQLTKPQTLWVVPHKDRDKRAD